MSDIYNALADHQKNEDWKFRDLLKELHRWAEIFNLEFKLEINELTLRVETLHRNRLGHFHYGHNGFGLQGETAINQRYLNPQPDKFWKTLGTLLHELLHAWQQTHGKHGKRNYHNREFIEKAKSLGLIVDHRGCTQYQPDSPFMKILQKHGVNIPEIPQPEPDIASKPRGFSKLKKWTCGCTNVRVAVADFQAKCLICGNNFNRVI